MAAFAQFASDLDEGTRKQIERGQRVTELMKQNQYSPYSVAQMAISLYAANEGLLDDIAVNKIRDFEEALQSYVKTEEAELLKTINETGDYSDEIKSAIDAAIKKFKASHAW